jgi:hypothetical protein
MTKTAEKSANEFSWTDEISPKGLMKIDGSDFIMLKELKRLGRLKGIAASRCISLFEGTEYFNQSEHRVVVCVWEIEWLDGTITQGAGDAWWKNVKKGMRQYLAPFAQNRAQARALKDGLGIDTCSLEEIGGEDPTEADEFGGGAINEGQIAGIGHLLTRAQLSEKDALGLIDRKVLALNELTYAEAVNLVQKLSKRKSKK